MVNNSGMPPAPEEQNLQTPAAGQSQPLSQNGYAGGPGVPPQGMPGGRIQSPLENTVNRCVQVSWIYLGLQIACSVCVTLMATFLLMMGMRLIGGSYEYLDSLSTAFVLAATTLASGLGTFMIARNKLNLTPGGQMPAAWTNKNVQASEVFFGACAGWAVSIVLGLVVTVMSFFLSFFGTEIPEVTVEVGSGILPDLLSFITTVLFAPVLEELIFRGCILESLKKYSTSFAVVFSALLFALLHLNLYQGLPVFGMGLVFGWIYVRTGSLRTTIVLHLINNLVAMISGYLPDLAYLFLEIVLLLLSVAGIVFMVRERRSIQTVVFGRSGTAQAWQAALHNGWFWGFAAVFAISSLLTVVMTLMSGVFMGMLY